MRTVVFALCALFTLGIFVTMLVSIWSTRNRIETQPRSGQSLAGELVWAAIPCLMIVAAAIPAGVAILTSHSTAPRESTAVSLPAREAANPGCRGSADRQSARCGAAVLAARIASR
jgi:heme/copper-type cytochrome/quinol oxidase subunit 2